MKNIILIISLFTSFLFSNSINAQSKDMDNFTVRVDGLGCPFCAYGLEKKFKELKGIKKVTIDMETGIMNFKFPTADVLSIETIEEQVEKAGYTPVSVKITRADGKEENSETQKTIVNNESILKDATFPVGGNCDMCKARIEKAALGTLGVTKANWDKESEVLSISYDENQTNPTSVEIAVAKSGHDTKNNKAKNSTYEDLPACCLYRDN